MQDIKSKDGFNCHGQAKYNGRYLQNVVPNGVDRLCSI